MASFHACFHDELSDVTGASDDKDLGVCGGHWKNSPATEIEDGVQGESESVKR